MIKARRQIPMLSLRCLRHFLLLAGTVLTLRLPAVAAPAAPVTVIIRSPAGAASSASLAPLLTAWRQSGRVGQVLLLTDGRPEKAGRPAKFGTLAVLGFADEASADRWQRDAAPALPADLIVRRADVLAHGEISPHDSSRSVFVVNTYTPLVPAAPFAEYVQGYVRPLYEAMRDTGNLVRYTAYLERGETGKVDALNVLEYRDQAAFAAMGRLKKSIREKVAAATPSYAQFDKIKDTLRIDGFGTFATWTTLPSP
jgi:hypothetical protein